MKLPVRLIVRAPVRICDCGGWTDTWFARRGRVCHIAVWPGIEVDLEARPRQDDGPRARVAVGNSRTYEREHLGPPWGPYPIVEAALAQLPPPDDLEVSLTVRSIVPPGASTGTSAAVAVAIVAAVDALHGGERTARDLAHLAHAAEVEQLRQQSGVQDQLAAAFGGLNEIVVDPYPESVVIPIPLSDAFTRTLEDRLLLVYLGRAHDSSSVHQEVIARLTAHTGRGEDPALERLRHAAYAAAEAIRREDLVDFGRAMRANTDAQRTLHPALVGADAEDVIAAARAADAHGWKVNGAGGDGGSLTVVCRDVRGREALARTLESSGRGWTVIPVRIARAGVAVTGR